MTGRPAWIPTDSICEQALEMASRGLTVSQISDCLGISESTLYAKQGEYTEFMDAIKKGRAEGLNKVSNALFEKATQGNVTAMIYYLKVRDRENWGENQPEPLREIPPMQIVLTGVSPSDQRQSITIGDISFYFKFAFLIGDIGRLGF